MKIAYPLKQDATDPRVVLDANLSVICTFLEGEHAEEMVERMNGPHYQKQLFDSQSSLKYAEECIEKVEGMVSDVETSLDRVKDILNSYQIGAL